MVDRLAVRVQSACTNKLTRVLALAADAGLVVGATDVRSAALEAAVVLADLAHPAVGVDDALHLGALHVGVARVARAARAVGPVVHGLALGVGPTRRWARTRVYALTVDARVRGRAVSV